MKSLLGIAYGRIEVFGGTLSVYDEIANARFGLVISTRKAAERILEFQGDKVKLTFEMCSLSHEGYVTPLQIERFPTEYHLPEMHTLIYCNADHGGGMTGGLSESKFEQPSLMGHLMTTHSQGLELETLAFQLSPADFSVLMHQLNNPEDDAWFGDHVFHAHIQIERGQGSTGFYTIKEIFSVQTISEWELRATQDDAAMHLPPAENIHEAAGLTNEKPRRRPISTHLRYQILLRDGHRCVDCGASAQDDPFVRLEIDHRIPVSKGGTNDPENLQTLCWACNNGKSDRFDHKLQHLCHDQDPWSDQLTAC